MKKTTLFFLLLASTTCFSQLYVGSNTYLYAKNEIFFVKEDVNLSAATSNLYLRNGAQLIQGKSGTTNNSGLGGISVYQEGTSDNFDYNYWCSPVGIASASPGNGNFGVSMLNQPTTSTLSTPATLISGLNGSANPLVISTRWIHKLINASGYSQWIYVGGNTTLLPGEGFSMKGSSGVDNFVAEGDGVQNNPGSKQRYDFRGKPNDGDISIIVLANNSTLTGNPYPSAINLNAFLIDNEITGGNAYFWEQDPTVNSHYLAAYRGGYGTYASGSNINSPGVYVPATFNSYNGDGSLNATGTSSGLIISRRYSPIGQGFVIYPEQAGTLTFKNSQRVYVKEGTGNTESQFQKPALNQQKSKKYIEDESLEELSYLRLNTVINNRFTRQVALIFDNKATDDKDFGFDAPNMNGDLPHDVTFWLADDSFVIQGVNFDATKKIPLLVRATTNSTFKFSIPESVNFDPNQMVYLYDNVTETYHDIKTDSYLLDVSAGVYTDRFSIAFSNQTLGITENKEQQLLIYQDNLNHSLKVANPNTIDLQSFQLYDLTGKRLLSKKKLGSDANYEFSTSAFSDGVYIVEFITTNNEKTTQKILISKSTKK